MSDPEFDAARSGAPTWTPSGGRSGTALFSSNLHVTKDVLEERAQRAADVGAAGRRDGGDGRARTSRILGRASASAWTPCRPPRCRRRDRLPSVGRQAGRHAYLLAARGAAGQHGRHPRVLAASSTSTRRQRRACWPTSGRRSTASPSARSATPADEPGATCARSWPPPPRRRRRRQLPAGGGASSRASLTRRSRRPVLRADRRRSDGLGSVHPGARRALLAWRRRSAARGRRHPLSRRWLRRRRACWAPARRPWCNTREGRPLERAAYPLTASRLNRCAIGQRMEN